MPDTLHYFSTKEYRFQKRLQTLRDKSLGFLVRPLTFLRLTPNRITAISFSCVLLCAYFMVSNPSAALVLLFFHVLLDGVDGVLARSTNKSTQAGALIDVLSDHTGFVVVTAALVFYNFLNPALGFAYVYLYTLLVVLLLYCNSQNITSKFTFRSKYFLYGVFALWALWGFNIFQPAVIVFTVLAGVFAVTTLVRVLRHLSRV